MDFVSTSKMFFSKNVKMLTASSCVIMIFLKLVCQMFKCCIKTCTIASDFDHICNCSWQVSDVGSLFLRQRGLKKKS